MIVNRTKCLDFTIIYRGHSVRRNIMKKSFSKLLALALTASLVLSGCGGTSGSSDKEEDTSGKTEDTSKKNK